MTAPTLTPEEREFWRAVVLASMAPGVPRSHTCEEIADAAVRAYRERCAPTDAPPRFCGYEDCDGEVAFTSGQDAWCVEHAADAALCTLDPDRRAAVLSFHDPRCADGTEILDGWYYRHEGKWLWTAPDGAPGVSEQTRTKSPWGLEKTSDREIAKHLRALASEHSAEGSVFAYLMEAASRLRHREASPPAEEPAPTRSSRVRVGAQMQRPPSAATPPSKPPARRCPLDHFGPCEHDQPDTPSTWYEIEAREPDTSGAPTGPGWAMCPDERRVVGHGNVYVALSGYHTNKGHRVFVTVGDGEDGEDGEESIVADISAEQLRTLLGGGPCLQGSAPGKTEPVPLVECVHCGRETAGCLQGSADAEDARRKMAADLGLDAAVGWVELAHALHVNVLRWAGWAECDAFDAAAKAIHEAVSWLLALGADSTQDNAAAIERLASHTVREYAVERAGDLGEWAAHGDADRLDTLTKAIEAQLAEDDRTAQGAGDRAREARDRARRLRAALDAAKGDT